MKYGAVIAVTGTSGRAARIRELGGGSFLGIEERIIQNFRSAGVGEIAVVAGPQKKLVRRLQNHGAVFLREKDPDAEMFTLVRRGLEYFKDRCEMIFICPESVPFFTEQTVRLMMEQTADVVICCSGGKKGHPVMLGSAVVDQILSYQGEGGLSGAIAALDTEPLLLETGDAGTLSDAATKEEFAALVRRHDAVILRPEIRISFSGKQSFFDGESAALLQQIDRCGNVREACEKIGISYSKAWGMIRLAEEGLGGKIVERRAGGKDGGGASITERGRKLTELYQRYEEAVRDFSEEKYGEIFLESGFFHQEE
ncbi:MAG: NTP transferase domain-containing protein [Stomatobaculum sp.]|nr:NTP transferase domain-containing protein [Stomatobaculum sp.]